MKQFACPECNSNLLCCKFKGDAVMYLSLDGKPIIDEATIDVMIRNFFCGDCGWETFEYDFLGEQIKRLNIKEI
jgi:hypothetical protein